MLYVAALTKHLLPVYSSSMKLPEHKLRVRLIALDLDDTTLNSELMITPKTVAALQAAAARGIYVVLCSGRAENAMLKYVRTLDIAGSDQGRYLISMNGASVFDMHKRLIMYSRKVSADVLRLAYREAQSAGLAAEVYSGDTIFAPVQNEWTRRDAELSGLKLQIVDTFAEILKHGFSKMITPGDPEKLLELQDKLRAELGTSAVIFTSKPYFLEVLPPECGKGEAVLWLAGELGIPREETMAFGDSMNDESMIKSAGYGVAMVNGLDYIKNIADFVTRQDNNHDGIADFITEYVL